MGRFKKILVFSLFFKLVELDFGSRILYDYFFKSFFDDFNLVRLRIIKGVTVGRIIVG